MTVINPSTASSNLLSVTNPSWETFVPRKRWMMTRWSCFSRLARKTRTPTLPHHKHAKTRESTEQSSEIDSGGMNQARTLVVCGGGARSETQPHVEQQVICSSSHNCGHSGSCGARLLRKEAQPCVMGTIDCPGPPRHAPHPNTPAHHSPGTITTV